jgi:hypothetical protein
MALLFAIFTGIPIGCQMIRRRSKPTCLESCYQCCKGIKSQCAFATRTARLPAVPLRNSDGSAKFTAAAKTGKTKPEMPPYEQHRVPLLKLPLSQGVIEDVSVNTFGVHGYQHSRRLRCDKCLMFRGPHHVAHLLSLSLQVDFPSFLDLEVEVGDCVVCELGDLDCSGDAD